MALRQMGTVVRLNDYKDEMIALRFVDEQSVPSRPEGPDGPLVTQDVPRADIVLINTLKDGSLTAQLVGRTLVFQKAIANDLRTGGRDWAVGVLEQVENKSANAVEGSTIYQLSEPTAGLDAIAAAFQAANIDL